MKMTRWNVALCAGLVAFLNLVFDQDRGAVPAAPGPAVQPAAQATRPPPPTRDPHTPGYVDAKELPDGAVPPVSAEGNFILGPTHNPAPEMTVKEGVPHGTVHTF